MHEFYPVGGDAYLYVDRAIELRSHSWQDT